MKSTIAAKRRREGYLFILPGFLYMLIILGYPLVYNIILSFKNVNVKTFASGTSVFVGMQNYIDLFHNDTFLLVMKNTFVFTIWCLIFQFTIGFIFALFFSQKFTLSGPIRGMVLVGYMMPMSVTAMLGKNMFDVSSGVINDLLMKVGLASSPIEWLLNGSTAMVAVIAVLLGRHSVQHAASDLRSYRNFPGALRECQCRRCKMGTAFPLHHIAADEACHSVCADAWIYLHI